MLITEVSADRYDVPLVPGRESASAAYATKGSYLHAVRVRLTTESGVTGTAEVPIRPYVYGDTQPAVEFMVNSVLAPLCVGRDVFDLAGIASTLEPPRGVVGNLVAKAAIDVAAHDAIGRILGLPVFGWLGAGVSGDRELPLTWLLPLHETATVVKEAIEAAQRGYDAFKIKVGRDALRDVALVRELRRELGDRALLYADANEGYEPSVAERAVNDMADSGLRWIEDPCPVGIDRAARRRLADRLRVPVLGDASCHTLRDVQAELSSAACSMVMLKLPRTGYRGGQEMISLAKAYGAPCVLGTQGESAYGTVAAAHLALSSAQFISHAELSFFERMSVSTVGAELDVREGRLSVSDAPGVGVDLVVPAVPARSA
jgi:L-alanine-DL-glutamate epimerase-like enolase superfamily enzyme